MYNIKMFTTYDSKTELFLRPLYLKTEHEALFGFNLMLNDPESQYAKNPADFTLFEIGQFNTQTCAFDIYEAKKNLGNGLQIKDIHKKLEPETSKKISKKKKAKK